MYIKWHWLSFNLHIAFNPFDITTNSTLWSIPYRVTKLSLSQTWLRRKPLEWPLLPCDFNKSWQGPWRREWSLPGWGTWGLGPTLMATLCTSCSYSLAGSRLGPSPSEPKLYSSHQFTQPCLNYRYKYMLEILWIGCTPLQESPYCNKVNNINFWLSMSYKNYVYTVL